MARAVWDQIGEKTYETGVDHGMLYPQKDGKYPLGVVWNGLTSVEETPSGGDATPLYADNIKYLNLRAAEDFGATVGCYTYPEEWSACNGEASIAKGVVANQQNRNTFGMSYRTKVGNDTDGEDFAYKLHLIYGASSAPSSKSYGTTNESPEAIEFSFEVTTTPVPVPGTDLEGKALKPTACITIQSNLVDADALKRLEDILYGTNGTGEEDPGTDPRLPLPEELREIFAEG